MTHRTVLRLGSQGPEVVTLQQMLNSVPNTLLAPLIEDGLFGRKTLERVREFQRNAKLVVDGVVGPQTWGMLDQLTQFLLRPGQNPPVAKAESWRSEPYREAVLRVALAEALPVSKVSDMVQIAPDPFELANEMQAIGNRTYTPSTWRFGWPQLKRYFDEAAQISNTNWWRQTGEILINGKLEWITNIDGVRGHNLRVPQPGQPSGTQWCGIFATWCWIKAGVPTRWPWGGPPKGSTKRGFGPQAPMPKPGDILIEGGGLVHHSLLLPDDVGNQYFLTVNGNSDYQSVLIKPIKRSNVVAYCSLDDFATK